MIGVGEGLGRVVILLYTELLLPLINLFLVFLCFPCYVDIKMCCLYDIYIEREYPKQEKKVWKPRVPLV